MDKILFINEYQMHNFKEFDNLFFNKDELKKEALFETVNAPNILLNEEYHVVTNIDNVAKDIVDKIKECIGMPISYIQTAFDNVDTGWYIIPNVILDTETKKYTSNKKNNIPYGFLKTENYNNRIGMFKHRVFLRIVSQKPHNGKFSLGWSSIRTDKSNQTENLYIYLNFYNYNSFSDIDFDELQSVVAHELRHQFDSTISGHKDDLSDNPKNNIDSEDMFEFDITAELKQFIINLFYFISYGENRAHFQGIDSYTRRIVRIIFDKDDSKIKTPNQTINNLKNSFGANVEKVMKANDFDNIINPEEKRELFLACVVISLLKVGKMDSISNLSLYKSYCNTLDSFEDDVQITLLVCGYFLKKHKLMKYRDNCRIPINDYLRFTDTDNIRLIIADFKNYESSELRNYTAYVRYNILNFFRKYKITVCGIVRNVLSEFNKDYKTVTLDLIDKNIKHIFENKLKSI